MSERLPPKGQTRATGKEGAHYGRAPSPTPPEKQSLFGRAGHGVRWLAAAPMDWLGAQAIARGAGLISYFRGAARPTVTRERPLKLEERGSFDLVATALLHGILVGELERQLVMRRRQTALLAYLLFALASVLLVLWLLSALGTSFTGERISAAVEFLPFCILLYLLAFYQALINCQIRTRRALGWRQYLSTDQAFLPRW